MMYFAAPGWISWRRCAVWGSTRTRSALRAAISRRPLEQRYAELPAGTDTDDQVAVAGRIRAIRNSGMFIDLHDASGKIQIFSHKDYLSPEGTRAAETARSRRPDRRRRHGPAHAARRADGQRRGASRCWPRRCCRCPRNITASPISRCAIASAIST